MWNEWKEGNGGCEGKMKVNEEYEDIENKEKG